MRTEVVPWSEGEPALAYTPQRPADHIRVHGLDRDFPITSSFFSFTRFPLTKSLFPRHWHAHMDMGSSGMG